IDVPFGVYGSSAWIYEWTFDCDRSISRNTFLTITGDCGHDAGLQIQQPDAPVAQIRYVEFVARLIYIHRVELIKRRLDGRSAIAGIAGLTRAGYSLSPAGLHIDLNDTMVQRVGDVHLLVFADHQPMRVFKLQLVWSSALGLFRNAFSACEKVDNSLAVYFRDPLSLGLTDVPIARPVKGDTKRFYQPRSLSSP